MGQMALRRAAVALVAACSLMACSDAGSELAQCEEVEAAGYPALEEMAADSLPGVEYEVHRWSKCLEDDGGVAWPSVTVVLGKGQSKAEARELLVAAGWQPTERSEWELRKGDQQASISGVAPPQRTEVLFQSSNPA